MSTTIQVTELLYPYYHIAKQLTFYLTFFRVSVCTTNGKAKINEDTELNLRATAIVNNGPCCYNTKYGYFRTRHNNARV